MKASNNDSLNDRASAAVDSLESISAFAVLDIVLLHDPVDALEHEARMKTAKLWSELESHLKSKGCSLLSCSENLEGLGEARNKGGTSEVLHKIPRSPGSYLSRFHLVISAGSAQPSEELGRATHDATVQGKDDTRFAIVWQKRDASTGSTEVEVKALHALGYPGVSVQSLDEAARLLAAKAWEALGHRSVAVSPDRQPGQVVVTGDPKMQRWFGAITTGMAALLIFHAINPWLRSFGSRLQLPGFSYDFVTPDSVPAIAPLVVGVPTMVLLLMLWVFASSLGNSARPRRITWMLVFPVVTTYFFAVHFFVEGSFTSPTAGCSTARGWKCCSLPRLPMNRGDPIRAATCALLSSTTPLRSIRCGNRGRSCSQHSALHSWRSAPFGSTGLAMCRASGYVLR
ncbi:MAG: hypothetical protein R3F19_12275 [Verrucomicrobiales bacterium]